MATAAVSLACPLRRSNRLAHGARRIRHNPEPDTDNDSADELTPRALRALKRQRLALDPDAPRRRRKSPPQRRPKRTQATLPRPPSPPPPLSITISIPADADADADADAEPLTPLTPLTPSPESSPGHDRTLPLPDPSSSQPPPLVPPPLPPLDTLLPFDPPPQLDIQDQFPSFPQHQLYVPPNPVFVRDREINIWKLACQERVDCLLRRYGIDYIKSIVESQARSLVPSPPSQTMFRLYTPASYTYSLSSWASASTSRKSFPVDGADPSWPVDDSDWVDPDVDMEDDDEDDYEDDEDPPDGDAVREGEATIAPPPVDMQVDQPGPSLVPSKPTEPSPSPIPHAFPPPPLLTPPALPPLSSLHVPLLSEPPRAFMGRGTPPDRRRLIEWSGSGRFAQNGIGPPLFLSPVPQRHTSPELGMVPMSIDPPPPPLPPHTQGEWTSFLFSMLEGDGAGVGVGASAASEPTWYELGLATVPPVPDPSLELPLSHHPHTHPQTMTTDQPLDEASSSSTLRFALG